MSSSGQRVTLPFSNQTITPEEAKASGYPDTTYFLLRQPLYSPVTFEISGSDDESKLLFAIRYLLSLFYFTTGADMECTECGKERPFTLVQNKLYVDGNGWESSVEPVLNRLRQSIVDIEGSEGTDSIETILPIYRVQLDSLLESVGALRMFERQFKCLRNERHTVTTAIRISSRYSENGTFRIEAVKYGQFPSVSDLMMPDLLRARRVLSKEKQRELVKAIRLHASEVHIGAFAYLRRVFESLVEQAHQEAITSEGWEEATYHDARMKERIGLLSNYLPALLVKNKIMYDVLSNGVHELSEEECSKHFATVQGGIFLILENILAEREKRDAEKRFVKELGLAHSEIESKSK